MFSIKNEKGKKNRENLSINKAVSRPLQNVSYCTTDGLCSDL